MTDFYRPVSRAEIEKVNPLPDKSDPAIRTYCTSAGYAWALQIRGDLIYRRGKPGKRRDFVIATAALARQDVRDLIAALETLLAEYPELKP